VTLPLGDISKQWRMLASAASVATSTVAMAIHAPPGDAKSFVALGAFFATATAGLVYVLMARYAARRHAAVWTIAAVGALGACLWLDQAYDGLWASHVGAYQGEARLVGDELTRDGAAWVDQHPNSSVNDLLFDAGGVTERIWTRDGILRVRSRMRAMYFVCAPLFALCVLSTVQAVFCATRPGSAPAAEASGSG